jgi:hypothetical protein
VSLGELFPQLAVEVGEQLKEKISRLHQGRNHPTTPLELRKSAFLERALKQVPAEGDNRASL